MNQNSNNEILPENKILILYILKKVGKPISHQELLELILSVADINYFYFQQFLTELLDDKFIQIVEEEISLYQLTEKGINALELTIDLIPGIIKLKIDSQFKENLNSIKDKFSISAEYTPISEKDFLVTCKVIENHVPIFKLETHIGSKEHAKNIVNNWNNNSEKIYPDILNMLIN